MSWQVTNNNQNKEGDDSNREEYIFFPSLKAKLTSAVSSVTGPGFVMQTIHYFLNLCVYNFLFLLNCMPLL